MSPDRFFKKRLWEIGNANADTSNGQPTPRQILETPTEEEFIRQKGDDTSPPVFIDTPGGNFLVVTKNYADRLGLTYSLECSVLQPKQKSSRHH